LEKNVMDLPSNNTRHTTGSCTVHFYDVDANNNVISKANGTTSIGIAITQVSYPNDNLAHAYKAIVTLNSGTVQVVSNPVQLTVGASTRLLLNVTRDFDSTRHVFTCTLMSGSSLVTQQKTITLKLNNTVYTNTTMNGVSKFILYLSPQANNNQTAYNVVASFAGDPASTATATMTTLNGTAYDVCTTTQYNKYEPSTNSLLYLANGSFDFVCNYTPKETQSSNFCHA
jgi:hypothetical protein